MLLAGAVICGSALPCSAVPIRVLGQGLPRVSATRVADEVVVRGIVADEAGSSLVGEKVVLEFRGPTDGPVQVLSLQRCGPSTNTGRLEAARESPHRVSMDTDATGSFCLKARATDGWTKVQARFEGRATILGGESTADVESRDSLRASTTLRFESASSRVDLDRSSFTVTVALALEPRDGEDQVMSRIDRSKRKISLRDERGLELASAQTGGDGRARLEVATARLADAGPGEFEARFEGDDELSQSAARLAVARLKTVRLEAADQVASEPTEDLELRVRAVSARGPVTNGVIELTHAGVPIAASVLDGGEANLSAKFGAETLGPTTVRLNFIPQDGYHLPGQPIDVVVTVRGPSLARRLALALVAAALVFSIVLRWRRAPTAPADAPKAAPEPTGRPEIIVIEARSAQEGWRGFVVDAHDGEPIVNAEVRVVRPTFEGIEVLTSARTSPDGEFELRGLAPSKDALLLVEGEHHVRHEQALPAASVLSVQLVSRRRAMLDRLVRWARSRGAPFDSNREPTPGHVRRAAMRAGSPSVERWAGRVESSAFGPAPVTRQLEEEVGPEPGSAS
jgi:hypothetical protein